MSKFTGTSINSLIQQGDLALQNVADPEISAQMAEYGYDSARLDIGRTKLQLLEEKSNAQTHNYAQQKAHTATFKSSWGEGRKIHRRHAKIASAVLEDQPELLDRLALDSIRMRKFSEWLERAEQFYREALADSEIQTLLATGGLTAEVLTSGQTAVQAAVTAMREQEDAKGLAQQSTKDRDAVAQDFQQWLSKFWKIADVALADHPQWLERLGRRVRS